MSATEAMKSFHERWVFQRRAQVLSRLLAEQIPPESSVLDVGCGNGVIADQISGMKPGVVFTGLEIKPRPTCLVKVAPYDGETFPMPDYSVDLCMFVDVLHHTRNIEGLLREARRVARRYVLIKDHLSETKLDHSILAFMDWVGNRAHGVRLTYNYQNKRAWSRLFSASGLRVVGWNQRIPLYPSPFDMLFGRELHFIGLLATS